MIRKLVRQMLTAQVFSALTVSLCLLIDSVMIARYLGEEAIAAYGLSNPLLLAIGAIGTLLAAGIQVTCSNSLGKGLNNCSLADTGLTDKNRIVFALSGQDPDHISDFCVSSYYRVELLLFGFLYQLCSIFT